MKILSVGQATCDITYQTDFYPTENTKYYVEDKTISGGGSAATMALLLAKWNQDVTFITSIANDPFAPLALDNLKKAGVNLDYILEDGEKTPLAFVINNQKSETRTILNAKNLVKEFNPKPLDFTPDIIVVDGRYANLATYYLNKYPDALTMLDAGRYDEGTVQLAKLVDYVVCSHDFAKDYTKLPWDLSDKDGIKAIINQLNQDFNGKIIITCESHGCLALIDDEIFLIPSIEVPVIDSNGAGDIYHGAFAYGLTKEWNLIKTMQISNITAALSLTKHGAQTAVPELNKVLEIYEKVK